MENEEIIFKFLIKVNNYIDNYANIYPYTNPNIIGIIRKAVSRLRVWTSDNPEINSIVTAVYEKFKPGDFFIKNIFEGIPHDSKEMIQRYSEQLGEETKIMASNYMDVWNEMVSLSEEIPFIEGKEEFYF